MVCRNCGIAQAEQPSTGLCSQCGEARDKFIACLLQGYVPFVFRYDEEGIVERAIRIANLTMEARKDKTPTEENQ